jgi:hypothetical protein
MKNPYRFIATCSFSLLLQSTFSQELKSIYHNTLRQDGMNASAWLFGVSTGASFSAGSNENTLFRGNSMATRLFARYQVGNIGVGLSSGIIPGSISDNAVNRFIIDRKFPQDQLQVSKANPFNSYFLAGPAFSMGKKVQINADLQAGVFFNNPGSLSINQLGASRSLYRFDAGGKTIFPGFSGGIQIAYPLNQSTRFVIHTDYLQSTASVRLYDPQRGVDAATTLNRDVKLITAGIGIVKTFGNRESGSGLATGKKHVGNVKYEDIRLNRESGSGMATGKRVLPTVNKRDIAIDESGVHRMQTAGCGPVIQTMTHADGSQETWQFACPQDAAAYQRMSTNISVPRQTPGTGFGEKLAAPTIIHRDIAARNILVGRVRWSPSSAEANGIVTNKNRILSDNRTKAPVPEAILVNIYARETGSGMASGKRSRETGSGMATGRRQYQPVFIQEGDTSGNEWGIVKSNPLYIGNSQGGTNPLFETNTKTATGDLDGDGVPELSVFLLDALSGATVATTTTETGGSFFFANLPAGNYIVKVKGSVWAKKSYDVTVNSKSDWAGEIRSADDAWQLELATDTGSVETARALIKTKTKSNQSNDRTNSSSLVWSPRSNIIMNKSIGDLDGDGIPEMVIGSAISDFGMSRIADGNLPNALQAGQPIPGIIVKGGKNPGGNLRTALTDENGEFVFTALAPGSYMFTTELNYYINEEAVISVGVDDGLQTIVTSESNLTSGKDSAILKDAHTLHTSNDNQLKAQNNNTVRSNRTDNAIMQDINGNNSTNIAIDEPGVLKTNSNSGPVKWMAPESIKKEILNAQNTIASQVSLLNELDTRLASTKQQDPASAVTIHTALKTQQAVLNNLYQVLGDLPTKEKTTAIHDLQQVARQDELAFQLLQQVLSQQGASYQSISNVLKTKHDTVKNSISNIR